MRAFLNRVILSFLSNRWISQKPHSVDLKFHLPPALTPKSSDTKGKCRQQHTVPIKFATIFSSSKSMQNIHFWSTSVFISSTTEREGPFNRQNQYFAFNGLLANNKTVDELNNRTVQSDQNQFNHSAWIPLNLIYLRFVYMNGIVIDTHLMNVLSTRLFRCLNK